MTNGVNVNVMKRISVLAGGRCVVIGVAGLLYYSRREKKGLI